MCACVYGKPLLWFCMHVSCCPHCLGPLRNPRNPNHVIAVWLPHAAATLQWSLSASSPDFDNAPQAQADGSYGHWQLTIDQVRAAQGTLARSKWQQRGGRHCQYSVQHNRCALANCLAKATAGCRTDSSGFVSAGALLLTCCDDRLLGGLPAFPAASIHMCSTPLIDCTHSLRCAIPLCPGLLCCPAVCRRSLFCQLPAARSPSSSLRAMHHTPKKSA